MSKELDMPPAVPVWWDVWVVFNVYQPERGIFKAYTRVKERLAYDAITQVSLALGVPREHVEVAISEGQEDIVSEDELLKRYADMPDATEKFPQEKSGVRKKAGAAPKKAQTRNKRTR